MIRKFFNIVFGTLYCMDCGKATGSCEGEDSSDLCGSCAAKRDANGGNA